ncbi:hypothetical protein TCDM_04091 [Trypanosoma cruzi Dm28c]|uniref:Uncharacterized protein n=1 Tax=Trypanosoma cruzi Dm28c TaxID=1416333 RepID=V5DIF6_TRYCR|nr:hypothetical protein TCDM_04091 [Trypanosoma cruzi Dm28c]
MFTIDFSKDRHALGGLDRCGALCELPGVSSTKFRCSITPAPRVGAARELGGKQGLVIAERQILNSDYTRAVADVQNWTARIYFRTEEALNYRSARETNIAVFGGLFAESGDAVSTRGARLSERAARWPHARTAMAEIHSQINRLRLMAWGVSASAFPQPNLAGERRLVSTQNFHCNSGNYIFLFVAVASPSSPWKRIPVQKVGCCIFLHWRSPPGLRVCGMRASPKFPLISGAHTVMTIGTRRTLRFSQPLTVWYRAGARWRQSGIPPIVSRICLGPYCRTSSRIS